MGFSERVRGNAEQPLQCGICRQPVQEARRIRNAEYKCEEPICQNCYRSYFLNRRDGLDAGIMDDPDRTAVRYRAAEPLEHELLFRRKEPRCGYEYPFPEIVMTDVLRDTLFWALCCIGIRFLLWLTGHTGEGSICALLADFLLPAASLIWAMRYLYKLVRGIWYGMGYTRQFVLTAAMIVQALLAWLCRTGKIFW